MTNSFSKLYLVGNPVESFLKLLRGVDSCTDEDDSAAIITKEIFLNGDCGRLAIILKCLFPEARFYFSNSEQHVLTLIDNKYYDIRGEYKDPVDSFKEVDEEFLINNNYTDNYSFALRGPII